jgi:hypothetical protein
LQPDAGNEFNFHSLTYEKKQCCNATSMPKSSNLIKKKAVTAFDEHCIGASI